MNVAKMSTIRNKTSPQPCPKKWLLLETFASKLSTIGKKWVLLESFGEACLKNG